MKKEIVEEGISGWIPREKYMIKMDSIESHEKKSNGWVKHYKVTIDLFDSKEECLKVYNQCFFGRIKICSNS